MANEVFDEVQRFYERAKAAVAAGRYDEPVRTVPSEATSRTPIILTTTRGEYRIDPEPWHSGDFSLLYRGQTADRKPVIAKVAKDPMLNQYLAHEAKVLKRLTGSPHERSLTPWLPYVVDSLMLVEAGNEQYFVNLFTERPGFVSLTEIKHAYPNGLRPEVAAWVWRRTLGQTLAANMLGVVHGAIVPDHVLVHPKTHDPLHIGWAHSVIEPEQNQARLQTVIDRWRDWYPEEVLDRQVPTHQTDLYMAGKCMLYLLGGDVARNRFPSQVPETIVKIVRRSLASDPRRRPRDGLAYLREFTNVIHNLWGRTYKELKLPK